MKFEGSKADRIYRLFLSPRARAGPICTVRTYRRGKRACQLGCAACRCVRTGYRRRPRMHGRVGDAQIMYVTNLKYVALSTSALPYMWLAAPRPRMHAAYVRATCMASYGLYARYTAAAGAPICISVCIRMYVASCAHVHVCTCIGYVCLHM